MPRRKNYLFKFCKRCAVGFSTLDNRKVYCTRSCAAIVNNTIAPKRRRLGVISNRKCLNCDQFCKGTTATYCSIRCLSNYKYVNYINGWLSGVETGGTASAVSPYVKKYLLLKIDNKCSKCGWNEINLTTGRSPLQVNHIDGNGENHKEENLEIICPNCHALTSTYGSLNTGKGRKYRRDKYRRIGE